MCTSTGCSPFEKLLWSIQTRVEYWTLTASSFQFRNVMLRMMTFDASETLRPQPEMTAPELPRMLLFEPTRIMPEHEIVPEMRMTAALVPETALVSEEALFTVTAEALPPPAVPPPWVAQSTSRLVAPPSTAFGSSRTLPLSLDLSL